MDQSEPRSTRRKSSWTAVSMVAGMLAWTTPANADAGVPVLAVVWPWFWLLMIPIVLVEARIAERECALGRKRAFIAALSANLVTAVAGVPVASIAMIGLSLAWEYTCGALVNLGDVGNRVLLAILSAPWLPPHVRDWQIYIAAAVLLIPTFFVSVYLEEWVMRRWVAGNPGATRRWAWRAHLITYGGMLVIVLGALAWRGGHIFS